MMLLARTRARRILQIAELSRGPKAQPAIARGIAPGTVHCAKSRLVSSPNGAHLGSPLWGSKRIGITGFRFPGAMPLAIAERRVAAAFPAESPLNCHVRNPTCAAGDALSRKRAGGAKEAK